MGGWGGGVSQCVIQLVVLSNKINQTCLHYNMAATLLLESNTRLQQKQNNWGERKLYKLKKRPELKSPGGFAKSLSENVRAGELIKEA